MKIYCTTASRSSEKTTHHGETVKTDLTKTARPGIFGMLRYSSLAIVLAGMLASPARAALLVEYNFNEGTGTAVDNTGTLGSAADGTLNGGWSTDTPSGTGFSVSFTGADATQGVTTGSVVAGLNGLSQVTGVLWLNLQAAPTANDRLLSNASSGAGFDLAISAPGTGTISASNYSISLNVDSIAGSASATITQGGWVFLAFTYDGTISSNNVKFYLGTVSTGVAQLGTTKTQNAGVLENSTNPFEVGNTGLTTGDRTPPALFDDVRIYNTMLDLTALEAVRLSAVPEPASWAMLTMAALFVVVLRRRRTLSLGR